MKSAEALPASSGAEPWTREGDAAFPPPVATTIAAPAVSDAVCKMPPVIILNMASSGLGIARDLRQSNIRVLGLSANEKLCGNFTRLCEVRIAPDSQNQPEKLLAFLSMLVEEFAGAIIFPTRDADVVFLDRFRSRLEKHFRLGIPPHDCLMRVINKNELASIASRAGIPAPHTIVVNRAEDLAQVPAGIGFPCVVKPVSSFHWRKGKSWDLVGGRKGFLVENANQLREEYERVCAVHPCVLSSRMGSWIDRQHRGAGRICPRELRTRRVFHGQETTAIPQRFRHRLRRAN